MSRVLNFPSQPTWRPAYPVPEFLKRDRVGATTRLLELMEAPEWKQYPRRLEFAAALGEALGIDSIDVPPPEAA